MPTLKNSKNTNSEEFTCPCNSKVTIYGACPVIHCPYHKVRLDSLFNVTSGNNCSLFEPELQGGPTLATLQKSDIRKVSATTLRTVFNQALEIVRSKLKLVNDIPEGYYCAKCGKEDHIGDCSEDRKWSNTVLDWYGLLPNPFRRALVWKLISENKLFLPKKLLDRK